MEPHRAMGEPHRCPLIPTEAEGALLSPTEPR